jgi:hypothetical protein
MKGKKTPKVYEVRITLLACRRDNSTTIHPRIGVRVSSAARESEVSMPSCLQRLACIGTTKSEKHKTGGPRRSSGPLLRAVGR